MFDSLQPALFEATIRPHRSLSSRGLFAVIGAVCALSAGVTTLFWRMGAWPVAGFSGAEVGLAILLIRHNARTARAVERVHLFADRLLVSRTDHRGRRSEHSLPPGWLRVVIERRPGRLPALLLTGHGVRQEIAAVLNEAEKRDLAHALARALHRLRNPHFSNQQLR